MLTKTPVDAEKAVIQLREWYNKQSHMPQDLEDKILLRFLHSCYYKIEDAKNTIEVFFSIRASSPELLHNRDPLSSPMQMIMSILNFGKFDLPGNKRLWVWQLNDPGLEKYNQFLDIKLYFMLVDVYMLQEDMLQEEDIAILDLKDLNIKYLTKFNISAARKFIAYQEGAVPVRLKQIHLVNCPPVIDTIFGLFKPFLHETMRDKIHFHYPNSNTLFNFIEKENLPEDFGGTRDTMTEHMKEIVEFIMDKRDLMADDNFWKCEKKTKEEFSIEVGSFKSLDID